MKSSSLLVGFLCLLGLAATNGSIAAQSGTEGIRAEEIRLEDLAVLALDPAGGRAVLQLPDGSLRTMAPGEELREARIRVRKVLVDRIVFEDIVEDIVEDRKGAGKSRRQIWIFRARPGERSRVQVLDRERPAPPPILKPQSMGPEEGSGNG